MKKHLPSIFCYEDVKDLFPSKTAFKFYVFRNYKKEKLLKIKNGLYVTKQSKLNGQPYDKYQIASHLFSNSFISSYEALIYYNFFNNDLGQTFTYYSRNRVNPLRFDGITYISKKAISTSQVAFLSDKNIRIVSLERAIVDFVDNYNKIDYPDIAIYQIIDALKKCKDINSAKIIEMLKLHNTKFLYKKIGYLFEKSSKNKEVINFCQKYVGETIYYFVSSKEKAVYCPRWKLMVDDDSIRVIE